MTVSANSTNSEYAYCPSGQVATGGGIGAEYGGDPADRIVQDGPTNSSGNFANTTSGSVPTEWYGTYYNATSDAQTVYVWVLCAP